MASNRTSSESDAWLSFRISNLSEKNADARALANLLTSVADAVRTAARVRLGLPEKRAGRLSSAERHLAAIRVVAVHPGSVVVELEEPPPVAIEQGLLFDPSRLTADLVISDLMNEFASLRKPPVAGVTSLPVRRAAIRLARRASAIGGTATMSHRVPGEAPTDVTMDVSEPFDEDEPARSEHTLTLFGHAYMLDVEQGRERIRVKLPSQLDVTMSLGEGFERHPEEILDQPVQVTVLETREGTQVVDRKVLDIQRLDLGDNGPERPPRSIRELAEERGLIPGRPPPYAALARNVWPEESDFEELQVYLRSVRAGA